MHEFNDRLGIPGRFRVDCAAADCLQRARQKRPRSVQSRLDSALATEAPEVHDLVVDLRKDDQISSIPWLNQEGCCSLS